MAKMLQFNQEALNSFLKGIKKLFRAVAVTIGPKGRNVVIHKGKKSPLCTKDGATVAQEIFLKDAFENVGAQLVEQASSKVSAATGDGTTTTIVLAYAIYKEGMKNVGAGVNPILLKKGIDKAVAQLLIALDKLAIPVTSNEEIKQIATISANNDAEIGEIVAAAMQKVGQDGIITIAEAKGTDTVLSVVEGMQIDKGYLSPYFVNNAEKMMVEYENPFILITDKKLSQAKELVPLLEKVKETQRPLLMIADDMEEEALTTLVINKLGKSPLPVCAIGAPSFGDRRKAFLEDIAILTGATFITESLGLFVKDVALEALGTAKSIKISKDSTTIIDGFGDKKTIQNRIAFLRAEIERETLDYAKQHLEERLAKLSGGVAIINVGAGTEAALKEKKERVEDALHATRAAAKEGVVAGGGVALLRAIKALDSLTCSGDEAVGVEIIRKAAFAPTAAIAHNCGKQGDLIAEKVFEQENNWGYNALTDQFSDLVLDGVIDPVRVTKSALIHAASVSSMLLTITAVITEKSKPKSKVNPSIPNMDGMMGGGMGGMMSGMDF
ncbi:MAG: chaperonin GroEL [Chlamydiales bacterium]|jgi:chaperonin GroEL|nr:chaperonin GroEL [Chlamydiales bacterium]